MATVLVTGGAGFIGSHLCCGIASRHPHWQIVALDNLHRRGSELNLERLKKSGVKFIHGDVRLPFDWPEFNSGPRYIIHCAAETSVLLDAGENPGYAVESNLIGTYHCLEYARCHDSTIVFISTSRTYPINRIESLPFLELQTRFDLPKDFTNPGISYVGVTEDFEMNGARSLYGCTKLSSELLLEEYVAAYGLKTIINRCSVVSGPGQMGKVEQGVFALWVAAHYFKQPLTYISYGGNGKQVRDFLHIDDLVDLICWQLQNMDEIAGKTFNVGGGRSNSLSLVELTTLCRNVTGNAVQIRSLPQNRQNDIRWYISDIHKISSTCDWIPKHNTSQMVQDVLSWLKDEEELLEPIFK